MNRWLRIDDRLIHGQITIGWRPHLQFETICVIDEALANDPYLASVLQLAAPDLEVQISGIAQAGQFMAQLGEKKALLLVKSPHTALTLHQNGIGLPPITLGNVAAAPGRQRIYRSISLSPAEIDALNQLALQGISITVQQTPTDPPLAWENLIRSLAL